MLLRANAFERVRTSLSVVIFFVSRFLVHRWRIHRGAARIGRPLQATVGVAQCLVRRCASREFWNVSRSSEVDGRMPPV